MTVDKGHSLPAFYNRHPAGSGGTETNRGRTSRALLKDSNKMTAIEFLQHGYNWAWAATALVSGGLLLWPLMRPNAAELTPAAATLLMNREDAVVVDVRETAEWAGGHIANARHIALGQFDKHLVEIEKFKQTPVILCCATGAVAKPHARNWSRQASKRCSTSPAALAHGRRPACH